MTAGSSPGVHSKRSTDVTDWREHIIADPAILVGKPTVRGTRLSVELILSLFAAGWSVDEVLRTYPTLQREALPAVFAYAADAVRSSAPLHAPVAG